MRDLRIVFMGTPDFAVATLKALLEANYNVVGVITAPDKPAGRGRKMHQSAVKKFALEHNLNVLQPTNLKRKSFVAELKALHANLQIVVAFRMLPKVVWQMPEYGTFNLHASLLPNYRGAAPINWAIINGETKTGVTTFFIDEKIDTGAMIFQEEIPIDPIENAGSLHDKLMNIGSALVVKTVQHIEKDEVTTTIQPISDDIKTAYKIHKETCEIDWTVPIDTIFNRIRGLSPYPASWTTLYNGDDTYAIKIYEVAKVLETHSHAVGSVISSKKEIKIAVKEGYILLKVLQLPGKRKMEISALLNGFKFEKDAKVS
ncbi:methionyl-tRNA formyltransferase [Kordia sp. YSTF-M3]|uniref:Methionyl-tRNA formyltransferase n=1 Tax=Kordia aestuariivivens TaxID=2759037 RepID=A0ABR7Q6M2_9FLAO|nr:methionyl-tRNA formyltransferase [Kordia aestuariivivens]MBC8753996.1 methionyl-tRNA formyltransferase [Kordia aestuariivivens]